MIIAEGNAKDKVCMEKYKAAIAQGTLDLSHNLFPCLGSTCAMWRWAFQKTGNEIPEARKGYCGLAGKAEYE